MPEEAINSLRTREFAPIISNMTGKSIRILLVDDDITLVMLIEDLLIEKGYIVDSANSFEEAETRLKYYRYQIIISDFVMPDRNGIELLQLCRRTHAESQFIMVTAYGSIENAVSALKKGAFDYLTKPIQLDELLIVINKALEHGKLRTQNAFLSQELQRKEEFFLSTRSPPFISVLENLEQLRDVDSTVLLQGETGTGKEVLARLIHKTGTRKNENFVPINCGALSESLLESELFGYEKGAFTGADSTKIGKLEFADGGTLFLDEVEAMTQKAQVSLLRFLQEGEISRLGSNKRTQLNVRVIAATNKDLKNMFQNGDFREDLYYRLSVFPLTIPPLRNRREDIIPLATWLLHKFCVRMSHIECNFSPDAKKALLDYPWPGNIRELKNCLERAVIVERGEVIQSESLFLSSEKALPSKFDDIGLVPLRDLERAYIFWALDRQDGNKTRTAEKLGITARGLYYKLKNKHSA